MYKLEDRVLFDAALPVDIVEAVEPVVEDVVEETVEQDAVVSDAAETQVSSDDVEADSQGSLAEALEALTEYTADHSNELYIVDTSVADYQTLIEQIPDGAQVELISPEDGLGSISSLLENYDDLDAIHILSHGEDGSITLGGETISSDNISLYTDTFKSMGESLTAEGDIMLYGCNVAESETGEAFVEQIAHLTNADVAASDNYTGAVGDWDLEFATGSIESAPVIVEEFSGFLDDTANTKDGIITKGDVVFYINANGTADEKADVETYIKDYIDEALLAEINDKKIGTFTFDSALMDFDGDATDSVLTITVDSTLSLSRSITIDGDLDGNGTSDVVFDGGAKFGSNAAGSDGVNKMFYIDGNTGSPRTVAFTNLTIQNINSNVSGAAIKTHATGARVASLTLDNVTITNVHSTANGGAVYTSADSFSVTDSTFSNNSSGDKGGAIFQADGVSTIENSTFDGNSSSSGGGAFYQHRGISTIENSTFVDNIATGGGGAVFQAAGASLIVNSTFFSNEARDGGAICFNAGTATVINSTITANEITNNGAAVYVGAASTLNLANTIIAGNNSTKSNAQDGMTVIGGATIYNLGGNIIDVDNIEVLLRFVPRLIVHD